MVPRARRPTRAQAGDVDLVDTVKPSGCVPGKQAREPGGERGSHHNRQGPLAGFGIQAEKASDLIGIVTDRHDVGAVLKGSFSGDTVSPRHRKHYDVGLGDDLERQPAPATTGDRYMVCPERLAQPLGAGHIGVDYREVV